MSEFLPAFNFTMKQEDSARSGAVTKEPPIRGVDNNPSSPTYGTKIVIEQPVARFGINSHAHPEAVTDGFYTMPNDKALIYAEDLEHHEYFNQIIAYNIADQDVANKFFDFAINMGVSGATKVVQRALNSLRPAGALPLVIDGKPGAMTIASINAADPVALLNAIKDKAHDFYVALAAANPDDRSSLNSWLVRADA